MMDGKGKRTYNNGSSRWLRKSFIIIVILFIYFKTTQNTERKISFICGEYHKLLLHVICGIKLYLDDFYLSYVLSMRGNRTLMQLFHFVYYRCFHTMRCFKINTWKVTHVDQNIYMFLRKKCNLSHLIFLTVVRGNLRKIVRNYFYRNTNSHDIPVLCKTDKAVTPVFSLLII